MELPRENYLQIASCVDRSGPCPYREHRFNFSTFPVISFSHPALLPKEQEKKRHKQRGEKKVGRRGENKKGTKLSYSSLKLCAEAENR